MPKKSQRRKKPTRLPRSAIKLIEDMAVAANIQKKEISVSRLTLNLRNPSVVLGRAKIISPGSRLIDETRYAKTNGGPTTLQILPISTIKFEEDGKTVRIAEDKYGIATGKKGFKNRITTTETTE